MSRVKGKDTSPEMRVRRIAHAMGLRFRLHRTDLPGKPDIVFPKYRKVVFVHGCFWHRHPSCKKATLPKSNVDFWRDKFRRNVERDRQNRERLIESGWDVAVIWECQTRNDDFIIDFLKYFFEYSKRNSL